MTKNDIDDRIALAALGVLESCPWDECALEAVAKQAGLSRAKVAARACDKTAFLPLIAGFIDRQVETHFLRDANASDTDALFDVLMTRFEELQKHRNAFLKLIPLCRRVPEMAWALFQAQKKAMGAMLRFAAPNGGKPGRTVRMFATLLAYQYGLCRWENDKSADLSSTMAALDLATKTCLKAGLFESHESNSRNSFE